MFNDVLPSLPLLVEDQIVCLFSVQVESPTSKRPVDTKTGGTPHLTAGVWSRVEPLPY